MKKISLLLVTILLLSLLPVSVSAAGHNAVAGMAGSAFDEASVNLNKIGDVAESLSFSSGAYMLFRNVDFGQNGVFRADVKIGAHLDTPTYMGGIVEMRLDGQYSEPIAAFQTDTTANRIHSVELAEPITGVHDVYLVSIKSQPMKVERVQFQEYAAGGMESAVYSEPAYLKDIQDTGKKDLIYTLIELGLIEPFLPDEYNPYIGIPRGKYAVSIARILGYTGSEKQETGFSDVDPTKEYAGAVSFLQSQGIIQGHGDGSYVPEVYITVSEALTMAVRALGYESMVAASGKGYPAGYVSMASNLGLTKGITMGDKLTRGDLPTLINNIINAEYLETTGIYGTYEQTEQKKGIMQKTRDLNTAGGMVTANSFTTLAAPIKTVSDGKVIIGGETYSIGDTYGAALLGYEVDFYYTEIDGEKTLVSVSPSKNVEVLSADTAEGDGVNTLTEREFSFYDAEEDDTETVKLSGDTHIIYNGKAVDDSLANMLQPGTFRGRVRLVECGGESTLIIDEYTSIWVKTVQTDRNKLFDGLTETNITFDMDKDDVALFNKGRAVGFSTLAPDSILSVYESKNKTGAKLIRMHVSTRSIEGSISSIDDNEIYIGEFAYPLVKDATQDFIPGLAGYFLLNEAGEVVAYTDTVTAADFKVGLLADFKTQGSIDVKPVLRMYEETDAYASLTCADKVTIDGIRCESRVILNGNDAFAGLNNMNIKNTLVRYRVNEAGEVIMIDTYLTGAGGTNDTFTRLTEPNTRYRFNGTSQLFVYSNDHAIAPYSVTPALFGFKTAGDAETVFYSDKLTNFRDSSYAWNSDTDTGELYCLDRENPFVSHVIWQGAGGSTNWGIPFVVSEKTEGHVNGEVVIQIKGYRNTAECSYYIKKTDYNMPDMAGVRNILEHVKPGDVLRTIAANDGEMTNCDIQFLANGAAISPGGIEVVTNKTNGFGEIVAVSRFRAVLYGEVVAMQDGFAKVEFATGEYEYVKTDGKCMRYSYRNGRPTVENNLTAAEELSVGDKVLYIAQNYQSQILCIYDHPDLVD